ncbi:baseplate J/gp47 family protein [Oscillospiraceae bacterium OttesenSCG-928-F05]|nr:baseplate J/gp47 family protein [Oscillospiraceae bacterium OttesenSCG-928-F05]
MIDERILDEVLPVAPLEELKEDTVQALQDEGFVITNFAAGGIFHTLMMIVLRLRIEGITLFRKVLNQVYFTHASGVWLDLKAADFSKIRKPAVKARGAVTVYRPEAGDAVRIAKGHVFKTGRDINGEELRFFALENTVLPPDALAVRVPVEAEKTGSAYNLPPGQIIYSLTHIEGGCLVTNEENWLSKEGSDREDDDGLRDRGLRAWSELSVRPTAEKYQNVAESVPGVLFATVYDDHPRGQGTVDIVITGAAGEASDALLDQVREAIQAIRGTYDNVLVKSAETVTQDIAVTVRLPVAVSDEGVAAATEAALLDMMRIRKGRNLNELWQSEIVYAVKRKVETAKDVRVTAPASDIVLDGTHVILAGQITVTVERS